MDLRGVDDKHKAAVSLTIIDCIFFNAQRSISYRLRRPVLGINRMSEEIWFAAYMDRDPDTSITGPAGSSP